MFHVPVVDDRVAEPYSFFFFNDTATTEIYTLSLHDALPICRQNRLPRASSSRRNIRGEPRSAGGGPQSSSPPGSPPPDRKSTRLNSSHSQISYAVFCLKKKKIIKDAQPLSDFDFTYPIYIRY